MRTREEIETAMHKPITGRYATSDYEYFALIMETLLDIRELLTASAGEK